MQRVRTTQGGMLGGGVQAHIIVRGFVCAEFDGGAGKVKRQRVDLAAPIADVVKAVAAPVAVPRVTYVWCEATITRQFARRPRVFHVEVSKPQGSSVGI